MNTVPEFKGNVKAIESAPLLHPEVVALKTAGWLNKDRDLKKNPITPEEQAMLAARHLEHGLSLLRRRAVSSSCWARHWPRRCWS